MQLKKLRLINFKKFKGEYNIDLQDINLITGKNGTGKTTIKEAIIFCLYNSTPEGSLSLSDKYITKDKSKALVELTFEYNKKEHIIRRERTRLQTKITYLDDSQSEEDSKITQETLNTLIPSFRDFSAVFNIGWFMSLNEKSKRKYILDLTPQVNRTEIFKKLGGQTEDLQKFNISLDNLDKAHKDLLALKLYNTNKSNELRTLIANYKKGEMPKITKHDISDKIKEIKKIQKKNYEIDIRLKEYNRIKENKAIREEHIKQIKDEISLIKIEKIEKPQNNLLELSQLREKYLKQINLPKDICPTCFQHITQKYRAEVEKKNLENKKELEKIDKEIKEKERKFNVEVEKWEKNEKHKQRISILKAQLKTLEPIRLPKKPAEKQEKVSIELNRLEKYQIEYIKEKNTVEIFKRTELEKEKEKEANKEELNKIVLLNRRVKKLVEIFSPKGISAEEMNMKLEPLKKHFQELIPNSDIITLQSFKNELGYKEVFRITINGKDYSTLSTGEKMRVDISVSQIINSLLPEKINVFFLDNSEVLDSSISTPQQSFICKVTNQPLKIN